MSGRRGSVKCRCSQIAKNATMGKRNIPNLTVASRIDTGDGDAWKYPVPSGQCNVHIAGSEADHAHASWGKRYPNNAILLSTITTLTDNNPGSQGRVGPPKNSSHSSFSNSLIGAPPGNSIYAEWE